MSLPRFPKQIISFATTKYPNDTTKKGFYLFLASLSQIYVSIMRWDSHCISMNYLIKWYAG